MWWLVALCYCVLFSTNCTVERNTPLCLFKQWMWMLYMQSLICPRASADVIFPSQIVHFKKFIFKALRGLKVKGNKIHQSQRKDPSSFANICFKLWQIAVDSFPFKSLKEWYGDLDGSVFLWVVINLAGTWGCGPCWPWFAGQTTAGGKSSHVSFYDWNHPLTRNINAQHGNTVTQLFF